MNKTKQLVLSALFVALGIVLPFLTGQIQQFGSMLCPMHFPIILCGFVCGWKWGLATGFITPLLRSLIFTMPPMMLALPMAFELATYGLVVGLLYPRFPKDLPGIYISLLIAMLSGRIIWGIVQFIITGVNGTQFGLSMWLSGTVLGSLPGIILQLILIPVIVVALQKTKHIN